MYGAQGNSEHEKAVQIQKSLTKAQVVPADELGQVVGVSPEDIMNIHDHCWPGCTPRRWMESVIYTPKILRATKEYAMISPELNFCARNDETAFKSLFCLSGISWTGQGDCSVGSAKQY